MAERRMFTKKITDSDAFIELSSAAQALYFHLNQGADDDGFNNQVQNAMFKAHASIDDLKILMLKNFIIRFESGVIVIKHWRMHNTLRKDRYVPTSFQEELNQLGIKDNGSYTLGCQMVAGGLPQDSIDKSNIVSKEVSNKEINNKVEDTHTHERMSYDEIFESFGVSQTLKNALIGFIRHCLMNKVQTTNEKLEGIIVKLDMAHGTDDIAKVKSIQNAISGGYVDIIENKE